MRTEIVDNCKLMLGDCLERFSEIPDSSVDLVLCDPPYGTTACAWDSVISFELMWENIKNVSKNNSVTVLFSSQPFTTKLISSKQEEFKYCWYWKKNQGTNFFHAKNMPIRKIEEICIFGGKVYFPQITSGHVPTNSAKGCSNGVIYHGSNKRNYEGGKTTRFPDNILDFKCVDNYSKLHPNEKPVALMEYLIRTYSNEGETVLDFTMGSGTTGVACVNTNRKFIGIEKEQKYFDIAIQRIRESKQQLDLFATPMDEQKNCHLESA